MIAGHGLRPGGGSSFSGGGGGGFSGGSSYSGSSYSGSSYSSSYGSSSSGSGDIGFEFFFVVLALFSVSFVVSLVRYLREREQWQSSGLSHIDYDELTADGFSFGPSRVRREASSSASSSPYKRAAAPRRRVSQRVRVDQIREQDPEFSEIVLDDFIYALYAKAQRARGEDGELSRLSPYLSATVRDALAGRGGRSPVAVGEVIVGAMRRVSMRASEEQLSLYVDFDTNYTEYAVREPSGEPGHPRGFYARERWRLVRARSARSRQPQDVEAFNCPSCGAPVEHDHTERCGHCGATHGEAGFDWMCDAVELLSERGGAPGVGGYAEEVGTDSPTKVHRTVDDDLAALSQRDPEFGLEGFEARVRFIYHELNDAWSRRRWEQVRPYLSDRLWNAQRYWVDAYVKKRLRNKMKQAKVLRIQPAKVRSDAFYLSLIHI